MARWIKCKSCGKSFAKQHIQSGICIICDRNSIAQPLLGREDTTYGLDEIGGIGLASENENFAFTKNTDDQDSHPQIDVDAEEDDLAGVGREPVDRANTPGLIHGASTTIASDFQAFISNMNAIRFAELLNNFGLGIGLFLALIALGVVSDQSNILEGLFVAGIASFIVIVGWSFTRIFIGIAEDVKATRKINEQMAAEARKKD